MSDAKWYVNDFCAKMLRILPRGREGTVLSGLELDCRAPLDAGAESRVLAAIGETLKPALAANTDIQRFVLLRRKKAAFDKQLRDAELHRQQLDAERQRIVLAGNAEEGQAARLAEIEAMLRSVTHSHAAAGGMCRALETEIERAKAAAERALHSFVGKERPQALQRATEARDAALAELCEIAAPVLDRLAAAIQELRAATLPIDRYKSRFARELDSIELSADAPTDAPPLPPAPPPAPPASQTITEKIRAAGGGTLPANTVTLQQR